MYKYFFLLLLLSCSFYSEEYSFELEGLEEGFLVISGDDGSFVSFRGNLPRKVPLKKFCNYYFSFYKSFYGYESIIPMGCIINPGGESSSFSYRDGFITRGVNDLHSQGLDISVENLDKFKEKSKDTWDIWAYSSHEFKKLLMEEVGISSVIERDGTPISSYSFLDHCISENPLQFQLYQGFHRFYSPDTSELLIVEVDDRGEVISRIIR